MSSPGQKLRNVTRTRKKQYFDLLNLPLEIRLAIYEAWMVVEPPTLDTLANIEHPILYPALLSIRHEAYDALFHAAPLVIWPFMRLSVADGKTPPFLRMHDHVCGVSERQRIRLIEVCCCMAFSGRGHLTPANIRAYQKAFDLNQDQCIPKEYDHIERRRFAARVYREVISTLPTDHQQQWKWKLMFRIGSRLVTTLVPGCSIGACELRSIARCGFFRWLRYDFACRRWGR